MNRYKITYIVDEGETETAYITERTEAPPRRARSRTSSPNRARRSSPKRATGSPAGSAGWRGWSRASRPKRKGRPMNRRPRAEGAPYRAKSASLFSSADFSKRSGNTSTPLLLVLRNRSSCNYRDQREKARGDLGILGKPLREPSLHFIDNLFREFLHINHRQHPLPGLVASPQLYRPGEGNGRRAAWQTYRNYRPRSARCW